MNSTDRTGAISRITPSSVGFTNEQANYINSLIVAHADRTKRQMDAEMDKIMKQLTSEIDELTTRLAAVERAVNTGAGVSAGTGGGVSAANTGALVTMDATRKLVLNAVAKASEVIREECVSVISAQVSAEVVASLQPQLDATKSLTHRLASQIAYQNTDTDPIVHEYRLSALREDMGLPAGASAHSGRAAIAARPGTHSGVNNPQTQARARRTGIIHGAVSTVFDEDDIV